jgi:hypothetical protein
MYIKITSGAFKNTDAGLGCNTVLSTKNKKTDAQVPAPPEILI